MIKSILDNDLYKFTMQWAVHFCFPSVPASYIFIDRDNRIKLNDESYDELRKRIDALADLRLTKDEEDFLHESCPFFPEVYIGYLRQFRYHPECVITGRDEDGYLHMSIENATWDQLILFEVVLMAIISELYFEMVDTDWKWDEKEYYSMSWKKGLDLDQAGCRWADFGTRRRRSYDAQKIVIHSMMAHEGFVGTSNVHFARVFGVKPIGTMAHEWIMGNSSMCSLRYANRYALENWSKVYNADLGVALTDTYGTDAFVKDFDMFFAKLFDGVRHDSGSPYEFADKIAGHYRSLRINPMYKNIVFSDGLDVETAISIKEHCRGLINCSFGIGTHFTNDFRKKSDPNAKSKALNMVIKLRTCNGTEVVKLSDNVVKATGDEKAIDVAKWTFGLE